jgi:uncharacterized protein (DUF3820 family)
MSRSNPQHREILQIDSFQQFLPFGKYAGETVQNVADFDHGYLLWLSKSGAAVISENILSKLRAVESLTPPKRRRRLT